MILKSFKLRLIDDSMPWKKKNGTQALLNPAPAGAARNQGPRHTVSHPNGAVVRSSKFPIVLN